MNSTQSVIVMSAHEESGLWEVISDLAGRSGISREQAFELLKGEVEFLESRPDICLVRTKRLYRYDPEICEVLEKDALRALTLDEMEFHESGPFYFLVLGPIP
jgi:hypothetical protein